MVFHIWTRLANAVMFLSLMLAHSSSYQVGVCRFEMSMYFASKQQAILQSGSSYRILLFCGLRARFCTSL